MIRQKQRDEPRSRSGSSLCSSKVYSSILFYKKGRPPLARGPSEVACLVYCVRRAQSSFHLNQRSTRIPNGIRLGNNIHVVRTHQLVSTLTTNLDDIALDQCSSRCQSQNSTIKIPSSGSTQCSSTTNRNQVGNIRLRGIHLLGEGDNDFIASSICVSNRGTAGLDYLNVSQ